MRTIPLEQVKRDNTNIRRYSDLLWRELRKTRFKPARPDALTNQMAAEQRQERRDLLVEFDHDINKFIDAKFSTREAELFRLFLYGGGMTQTEMAEQLGVCQATVAQTLRTILQVVKEDFYGCK